MLKCFLFWVTILDIIYFIVELSVGGVTSGGANPSLGPPEKTLLLLGAKYGPKIKNEYVVVRLCMKCVCCMITTTTIKLTNKPLIQTTTTHVHF